MGLSRLKVNKKIACLKFLVKIDPKTNRRFYKQKKSGDKNGLFI